MPIRDLILNLKETKSGHALLDTADDLDKAAKGMDSLGDSSKATTKDLAGLRAEVERSAKAAKDLKLQIARVGDQSLFGDLRKEESNLKRLQKLLADLTPSGGGGGGLGGIPRIGGIPGPAVAGIGAAAIALSPAIGATVAAAVLGGVGTGGVIGGVALAAQDTRVKSAFKTVGKEIFEGLGDSASPFVKPLLDSASAFGDAWRKEAPAFEKNFAVLAEAVKPLTEGVAGFVHNLGPGLGRAFRASIPLAEQFSEELADFGTTMSDFLDDMADAAPGAKKALHDLFFVIDEGMDSLGTGVKVLSGVYDGLNRLGVTAERLARVGKDLIPLSRPVRELSDLFDKAKPELGMSIKDLGDPTERLAREMDKVTDAAEKQAQALERLRREVDDYYDSILPPLDAEERWAETLLDVNDALAENGRSLSMNTREGLANRDAIEERFRAAKEMLDTGKLTEQQYQREIEKLGELGRKFNDTTGFVAGLVDAYKKIPSRIFTDLVLNTTVGGFASRALKDFLSGKLRTPLGTAGYPVTSGAISKQAFLDLPSRDTGGPVMPGQSYLIGGRPEILTMGSQPGFVTPMSGSQQVTVVFDVTGADEDLKRLIRKMVRVDSGTGPDSVQRTFGRQGG